MPIPAHHILGISNQATETEIRTAYRDLAKKWHPDKYTGSNDYATEQFKRIKSAYEQMILNLGNPAPPVANPYGSCQFRPTVPQPGVFGRRPQSRPAPTGNTFTRPNTVGCTQGGCQGGPVMFPGNFHPSQMSFEMLQKLRQARGS